MKIMKTLKRHWFIGVLLALLALTVFASGCNAPRSEPEPVFQPGQFVELRINGEKAQIIRLAYFSNSHVYEVRLSMNDTDYFHEFEMEAVD